VGPAQDCEHKHTNIHDLFVNVILQDKVYNGAGAQSGEILNGLQEARNVTRWYERCKTRTNDVDCGAKSYVSPAFLFVQLTILTLSA